MYPNHRCKGQRITGMTAGQAVLKCVGAAYDFKRYGKSGVELSTMLPHIGSIVDDITIMGTLDAVKAIGSARARLQKPANYQVNLTKQYVYTMNESQVDRIQSELKEDARMVSCSLASL